MVVTHLFQILAFTAMEPPTSLEPAAISREKNKVFRSMQPIQPTDVVRGQYTGYHDEPGVRHDSETETFVALKCFVDNWRWAGVPFYLRTGKRLAEGARIISIAFREPPQSMFPPGSGVGRQRPRPPHLRPRRQVADVVVVLREAARPGVPARQAVDAVLDAGDLVGRCRARGLRAADLRRRPRRPHPLHVGQRHRAALGDLASRSSRTRPPCVPTPRARGGRTRSTSSSRRTPGGCRSSASGASASSERAPATRHPERQGGAVRLRSGGPSRCAR